jgi:hypothetical protein
MMPTAERRTQNIITMIIIMIIIMIMKNDNSNNKLVYAGQIE